jgi:hypothetical protein
MLLCTSSERRRARVAWAGSFPDGDRRAGASHQPIATLMGLTRQQRSGCRSHLRIGRGSEKLDPNRAAYRRSFGHTAIPGAVTWRGLCRVARHPARLQDHADEALNAEPGVPETGVVSNAGNLDGHGN